jgi:thioesterase domain-containing protein
MLSLDEINNIFKEKIPLVGNSMHIEVVSADDKCVKVKIPMEGNANDKGTMFAGVSYSALVIAGWCLAMNKAYESGFEHPWAAIVDAKCHYQKALREDSVATAEFLEPANPVPGEKNWLKVKACIADSITFEGIYAVGIKK